MTTYFSALPFLLAAPEGTAGSSGGSMVTTFITFGLIIVVFYFLIIRPQRKREKETKAMINAVQKGDKVVTIGGIRGTVVSVKDAVITLKVDDNTKIEFSKSAVANVLDKKAEAAKAQPAEIEKPAAPVEEKAKAKPQSKAKSAPKKSSSAKSAAAAPKKSGEQEAEGKTETDKETEKKED
jgi:preprotein translocase subunit YajC